MPLPFAPPPDESRVYDSLKSVLLSDVTAAQLDSLRSTVFAQGTDGTEDEFRRLLLLGLAANQLSNSGPLVNTTKIVAEAYTGSAIYNNLVFQPDVNQVWTLDAASVTHSGGAGASIRTKIYLSDGGSYTIELGDESFAGNTAPFSPTAVFDGVKITNGVYITQAATGQTGGDEETSTVTLAVTRVR